LTNALERLDAAHQLISEYNAHIVLLDGKVAFRPRWNIRAETIATIESFLAGDTHHARPELGIIPFKGGVKCHVIDADRGDPADIDTMLAEVPTDPFLVTESGSRQRGEREIGFHYWWPETEPHRKQQDRLIRSVKFDSICATGYVALEGDAPHELLEALRSRDDTSQLALFPFDYFTDRPIAATGRRNKRGKRLEAVSIDDFAGMREGDGRNDSLKNALKEHAISKNWPVVLRRRDELHNLLLSQALGWNALFSEPMAEDEVAKIAWSVTRYLWERRNTFKFGTDDSEEQRRRRRIRSDKQAREMDALDAEVERLSGLGFTNPQIAVSLNKSLRTIQRSQKRIRQRIGRVRNNDTNQGPTTTSTKDSNGGTTTPTHHSLISESPPRAHSIGKDDALTKTGVPGGENDASDTPEKQARHTPAPHSPDGDKSDDSGDRFQTLQFRAILEHWRSRDFEPHFVLGVDHGSSDETIISAHRRKLLAYHPDGHRGDPSADELTKRLNIARDELLGRRPRTTTAPFRRKYRRVFDETINQALRRINDDPDLDVNQKHRARSEVYRNQDLYRKPTREERLQEWAEDPILQKYIDMDEYLNLKQ